MIKVENMTKQFNSLKAVDDVSLEIKKGEIVCLIGPSGSGKSTVLRCIHGLEKPEKGAVYLNDQLLDPKEEHYRELRKFNFSTNSSYEKIKRRSERDCLPIFKKSWLIG